jgi:hypothetical protein
MEDRSFSDEKEMMNTLDEQEGLFVEQDGMRRVP